MEEKLITMKRNKEIKIIINSVEILNERNTLNIIDLHNMKIFIKNIRITFNCSN